MFDSKDTLIWAYEQLLGYKEILEKLSKIYGVDFCPRVNEWVKAVEKWIDLHNSALEKAVEINDNIKAELLHLSKLKLQPGWLIDKQSLKPAMEEIRPYSKRLEDMLGEEFTNAR